MKKLILLLGEFHITQVTQWDTDSIISSVYFSYKDSSYHIIGDTMKAVILMFKLLQQKDSILNLKQRLIDERFYSKWDTVPIDKFGLRKIQDSIFRKKRDNLLLIHKTILVSTQFVRDTIKRDSAVGFTPSPPDKIKKKRKKLVTK